MTINIVPIYKNLKSFDFRILLSLELNMKFRKWVPVSEIKKYTNLSNEKIVYRLGILLKYNIIGKVTIPYEGYTLYQLGYTILSLRTYIKRETFQKIGYCININNIFILYEAKKNDLLFKYNEKIFIIKIYRNHISDISILKKIARNEYEIMNKLYSIISIPKPIDYNRNTIVFEKINGIPLFKIKLINPKSYFNKIILEIKKIYNLGIVHCNISEYNILISGENIIIINWDHYITISDNNYLDFLRRDLINIIKYFNKKYGTNEELKDILKYILTN